MKKAEIEIESLIKVALVVLALIVIIFMIIYFSRNSATVGDFIFDMF